MKTKQDNDMIYYTGSVYVKNYTKQLGSNGLGAVSNEN